MSGVQNLPVDSQWADYVKDTYNLGLNPFPFLWDTETKDAHKLPEHSKDLTLAERLDWLDKPGVAGLAFKLHSPYGAFDFDIKNTPKKGLFQEWLKMVHSKGNDVLNKVYIEETRNGGYHVFIKYPKLDRKLPLARYDGKEVISIYTGELLVYAHPTPGYSQYSNEAFDIQELSDDEFDILISAAAFFNEEVQDAHPSANIVVDYPEEVENIALQFDAKCTAPLFIEILNSIGLYEVIEKRAFSRKNFTPFLRRGSKALYSAKVYLGRKKRCLIFSGSMKGFPTWHDRQSAEDHSWSLTPTKLIYYRSGCDWDRTIKVIGDYCEMYDIEINSSKVEESTQKKPDQRLEFPYEVLPAPVQELIAHQTIQHDFFAGAGLAALAAGIGNTVELKINNGRRSKLIFYLTIVAPTGIGKSPAQSIMFKPLEEIDSASYKLFEDRLAVYKQEVAVYNKDKQNKVSPEKPGLSQILIKNTTVEMLASILAKNPGGCCVVADELSGFLKRLNQYKKDGDDLQAWLEMHTGSPLLIQRISRDETRVEDYTCSLFGGIQTGILEMLSKDDNQHNGFWQRFLFVIPEIQPKPNWKTEPIPDIVFRNYAALFESMVNYRDQEKVVYSLSPSADAEYERWFNMKNEKYNQSSDDGYKGVISKYQEYCLRFALLLQVLYDGDNRAGTITLDAMQGAIKIVEYFFANMIRAIRFLSPISPADKLPEKLKVLYDSLPESFSTATAMKMGGNIGIPEGTIKTLFNRFGGLFDKIERGQYEKKY